MIPVVSISTAAARTVDIGPIRLLFVDGLHTYEGVKVDIEDWMPRVSSGGIIVWDDYFNEGYPGVRRAVDEFASSGSVGSLHRGPNYLVWATKR